MIAISPSKILLFSSLLVLSSLLANQAHAKPWFKCIPNFVQDKILEQSEIAKHYKVAVQDATARFEKHLEGLEPAVKMDEQDKENLFMKLIAEEVNKLQKRVRDNQIKDKPSEAAVEDVGHSLEACKEDMAWSGWNKEEDSLDAPLVLDAKDRELMDKVKALEEEMGLALDEATKARLKVRTKAVLTDLLHNEVRQIGAAIVSAYLSGGSGLLGIIVQHLPVIQIKIVQYLMNSIIDIVRSAMGAHIEIEQPIPLDKEQPIAFDNEQAQVVLAN